jgi:opacity protein-like surface antigen
LQVFQRGNAFVHEGKFNLDYNVLSSKFTPFVSVGVGYLYLGADDRTSFDAWHFDLNAAAGVRWDVTDHLFLKAYAGGSWANVDHPDWAATFQATVAAGWRF